VGQIESGQRHKIARAEIVPAGTIDGWLCGNCTLDDSGHLALSYSGTTPEEHLSPGCSHK